MARRTTFATLGVSGMHDLSQPHDLLPGHIAVVCHDAGGANLILAMLARMEPQQHTLSAFMQGPAEKLWQQRFSHLPLAHSLEAALDNAEVLVSGTGWASDLEFDARTMAHRRGLRSVAVLDHWVNYPQRFERHGNTFLPDEIWVCDSDALRIARNSFPDLPLRCLPNFYLQEQAGTLPDAVGLPDQLLYVLEPMRAEWGRAIPGEFQALNFFAEHLALLAAPAGMPIRLRPHPSDPPGKYDDWIARHQHLNVALDDSPDLHAALASANRVAGCESFALVVALAAGRQVYCTLPPHATPCRLPHQGLIHLKDLRK